MWAVLSRTWHLYISMTFIMIGLGFQNAILPIVGKELNFSPNVVGYVMSLFYSGFLLGVYIVPKLIKNVGFVRVFATLATLCGSTIIIFGLVESPIVWIVVRFVMGICYSGLYLITETWINDAVDNRNRGNVLSIYMILNYAGLILGQYATTMTEIGSVVPFVWISLIISLSFIPVLLSVSKEPTIIESEPMTLKKVYKASPMGFVGMAFVGVGNAATYAIGGVYITMLGGSAYDVATFLLSATVGMVISMYPAGKISDIVDRRYVIIAMNILALIGLSIVAVQDSVNLYLHLGFALVNMGLGPLYSVCIAQTNDWIKEDQRIGSAAGLGLIYGLGSIIGSLIMAFMLGVIGTESFIYGQYLIYGGMLMFTISRIIIRDAQVDEEQASFIAYPSRSTNVAMDIYDDDVFESSDNKEQGSSEL